MEVNGTGVGGGCGGGDEQAKLEVYGDERIIEAYNGGTVKLEEIEMMKKVVDSYKEICSELNRISVEELLKVSTMEDVELLLQSFQIWAATFRLRLAITLGRHSP